MAILSRPGIEKLRKKVRRLYDEYEAILILTNNVTASGKKAFEYSKEAIGKCTRHQLQKLLAKIQEEIVDLRQYYGAKVSNEILLELAADVKQGKWETIKWVPKYEMYDVFARYDRVVPDLKNLPEHTYIGLDPGVFRGQQRTVELFLVEAKAFEDMCGLFNVCKDRYSKMDMRRDSKMGVKTVGALCRATLNSAFYFIEAYLNGIAFDFVKKNEKGLDAEIKGTLMDWDFRRNRPRYLSLRDKILRYPRIILGVEHPPLQESNSPEVRIITDKLKKLRDLIAHPSARAADLSVFFSFDIAELEEIVDSAISLVRRIEAMVGTNNSRCGWLYNRNQDGFFPEKVFE